MAKRYIGTSGFSYNHWKEVFYPANIRQSDWLNYYSGFFNTVELNVTFYRLPAEKTFLGWAEATPLDFRFTLKAPRQLTHYARLKLDDNYLAHAELFSRRARLLEDRLGCVLWQLPPGLKGSAELLERFIAAVFRLFSGHVRHAFEFRHESWASDEVAEVLQQYGVALVCSHSTRYPLIDRDTADFRYYRFHGPGRLYDSRYEERQLDDWALKMLRDLESGRDIYVYFNNDFYGYAVENALYLKSKLEELLSNR